MVSPHPCRPFIRLSAALGAAMVWIILALSGGTSCADTYPPSLLQERAASGDPESQCRMGILYARGKGVTRDEAVAADWFRKAAEQGFAEAQYILGVMYVHGRGVRENHAEAFKWLNLAAAQGYRDAARERENLARKLSLGQVESPSTMGRPLSPFEQDQMKAKSGDVEAQYRVGAAFYNGSGVEKNLVHALEWLRKAAEANHVIAQTSLGWMYERGEGVEQDGKVAAQWYSKAARKGFAMAQFNLGTLYEKGLGVTMDLTEAYTWFLLAAAQGDAKAAKAVEKLKAQLSEMDRERIEKKTQLQSP
jgi:uncharacterized protein